MKTYSYYYYSKVDPTNEKLGSIVALSRLGAAKMFAQRKRLDLKSFLSVYSISR